MTKIENSKKIILDLCGGTGSWSNPYKEAGYNVHNITLPDYDVRAVQLSGNHIRFVDGKNDIKIWFDKDEIYGILAAPPCTMFSFARTKAKKPRDLEQGFEVVRSCLDIIWSCMEIKQDTKKKTLPLKFWALENPNGMLKYFLGKPVFEFNPYDFGDQYQKSTHLWGWFNEPKKNPIKLTEKQKELHKTNSQPLPVFPEMSSKLTRQERRAITPAGFANAFFLANQ